MLKNNFKFLPSVVKSDANPASTTVFAWLTQLHCLVFCMCAMSHSMWLIKVSRSWYGFQPTLFVGGHLDSLISLDRKTDEQEDLQILKSHLVFVCFFVWFCCVFALM